MIDIQFKTSDSKLINEVNDFVEQWYSTDDYITTNTSGSTGKPKSIRIAKKHMIASASMTCDFFDLKPGMTALLCLSPKTIGGKMLIVRSIVRQLNLIVSDVCSNPLEQINSHIDFSAMVPMQVENSLTSAKEKLKSIGHLIIGGAEISKNLFDEISKNLSNAYQTFGMTETISHIALRPIDSHNNPYKLLPGISKTDNDVLEITAPLIGIDYLISNDIINHVSDREFNWIGRKDFVINSGGIKIHPEQIESKIKEIIDYPLFCIGTPNKKLGEQLTLCIEHDEINLSKVRFIDVLDKYEIPKEVRFFDSFSYTTSGKINKIETLKQQPIAIKQVL